MVQDLSYKGASQFCIYSDAPLKKGTHVRTSVRSLKNDSCKILLQKLLRAADIESSQYFLACPYHKPS
ncbi:MAG: hypothetical protein EAZ73_24395 [Oscillatoriales cyanobacterium]|nr:MAG: hypothetical protein EAZ73_24395 [Oscillatoriales cyanobacterium]